jgi:FkbM family methyltransferase
MFMKLFNYIYERAPYSFVHLSNIHIKLPNKDFNWTILLNNGEKVISKIHKDGANASHVALGYKWHDRGMNLLETIIINDLMLHHEDNCLYIDCGANLGMRSMSALSKNMKVVMIEPNEDTNKLNLERCKMNDFSNFELLTFGVSNSDEQKRFYVDSSSYLSTLSSEVAHEDNINIVQENIIEVRKLDTIFASLLNTTTKAYIKIDIEGHEIEALDGGAAIIKALSPTFLIEINQKEEHIQSLFDKMRASGYKIYEKSEPDANLKFLQLCPDNVMDYNFISDDFLFVNDDEITSALKAHIH